MTHPTSTIPGWGGRYNLLPWAPIPGSVFRRTAGQQFNGNHSMILFHLILQVELWKILAVAWEGRPFGWSASPQGQLAGQAQQEHIGHQQAALPSTPADRRPLGMKYYLRRVFDVCLIFFNLSFTEHNVISTDHLSLIAALEQCL